MALKRATFSQRPVYKARKVSPIVFAREKMSFLVASFTLLSFVVGNMVGQHGWYAFWRSVMGKGDDAAIIFTGTVTPLALVPDYARWTGANIKDATFRQVPKNLLVELPLYDAAALRHRENHLSQVYSVGNLGSYETGEDHGGSHVGVDIRTPVGTPVRSIANGIVEKVMFQDGGYGKYIVLRHPNMPDPSSKDRTTTLYSAYAHLDATIVDIGQVVAKGEQIGTSGQTGFAAGPHLHFQIDLDSAPFHPYWAFTSTEMKDAGLSFVEAINTGLGKERGELYTVSPLAYVQQNSSYVPSTIVVQHSSSSSFDRTAALASSRSASLAARKARAVESKIARQSSSLSSTSSSSASSIVASLEQFPVIANSTADVTTLKIEGVNTLARGWQKVRLTALDASGAVVKNPTFAGRLYVLSQFGDAEIRPRELSALDFVKGVATVNVLANGKRTILISTKGAIESVSGPIVVKK